MSKLNLRGKGKKDERISELEARLEASERRNAELMAKLAGRDPEKGSASTGSGQAGAAAQSQTPFQSGQDAHTTNDFTAPTGKVRRRQVRARAYTLYRGMGGDAIDQGLRNAVLKGRCFNAQVKASQQGLSPDLYGPTITPYEERMSTSLVARLSKEKRALLDLCMKEAEIDASECEEFGGDYEKDTNEMGDGGRPQVHGEIPRLEFTEEEKKSLLDWLENAQRGPMPEGAEDINRAIMFCRVYPQYMSTDLLKLITRIEEITSRVPAAEEPEPAGVG